MREWKILCNVSLLELKILWNEVYKFNPKRSAHNRGMLVMSSSNYILSLFKNYACGIITQTKRGRKSFRRGSSWLTSLVKGWTNVRMNCPTSNMFYWHWRGKEFAFPDAFLARFPEDKASWIFYRISSWVSFSWNSKALKFLSAARKRLVINWIKSISNFLPSKWTVSNSAEAKPSNYVRSERVDKLSMEIIVCSATPTRHPFNHKNVNINVNTNYS